MALSLSLALSLASCGGDDESTPATSIDLVTAAAAPTTGSPAATSSTPDLPVGTGDIPLPVGTGDIPLPVGTGDIPSPPDTADLPYSLSVTIGLDSNPQRIERVAQGTTIALSVTNPDADDEFHLHGYDLGDGLEMPAGQTATFTFVAVQPGSFELESHSSGAVLMVLEVV